MVKNGTEAIELFLLRYQSARRRLRGVFLQRPMHPFMSPILLRPSWLNAFVNDAELHPSQ